MPPLDPIFLLYLSFAAGTLALGILILALLRFTGRRLPHAWAACRGWALIIPLVFVPLYLGSVATVVFLTLTAFLACMEVARAGHLLRQRMLSAILFTGIAAAGVAAFFPPWCYAVPAVTLILLLIAPSRPLPRRTTNLFLITALWLTALFPHLYLLARLPHGAHLLLFLLLAVSVHDVAAYASGKIFGRHRLAPRISPNKTWEGAIGAFLVSLALPWLLRFSLPHFSTLDLLATGLIVGIGATLGDLMVSRVKRKLAIKDFGTLIPGHGGILDRIDSLLLTAPAFFLLVRYHVPVD